MENRDFEDGNWENRLLWKLKMVNLWRNNATKEESEKKKKKIGEAYI
jgi:hypothetical protein